MKTRDEIVEGIEASQNVSDCLGCPFYEDKSAGCIENCKIVEKTLQWVLKDELADFKLEFINTSKAWENTLRKLAEKMGLTDDKIEKFIKDRNDFMEYRFGIEI